MTKQDKEDIKEIVGSEVKLINTKLDSINSHLSKINGKTAKHSEIINDALQERARNRQEQNDFMGTRAKTCPQSDVIKDICQEMSNTRATKKYLRNALALGFTGMGIVWAVIEFFLLR